MSAPELLEAAAARGWTVGVAESLTGGLVTATLVSVPGASAVLRGGIVAYATDLKAGILGVDADLLNEYGSVDPRVAAQMATGVRVATGADIGLATTGVAGPDQQDGKEPGLVYVAVSTPDAEEVRRLDLLGGRSQVIGDAARGVLELAVEMLGAPTTEGAVHDTPDVSDVTGG
ncbi:CinA family protein [Antribacter sp. KLBMP9083]|uniref:CinA family protein n=1 Tax=Antribacter soli TaxID=2910976 RepID=A0AA41QHR4_9MICO|nr:CinA family protein [Antribacter soli]MCF4122975.1 CinA family protein [Antribacter soli]